MLDEHEVVTLYFDPEINRFIDEFGSVIHDIHRLITPSQLMLFKRFKEHYVIPDVTNSFLVELIWPDTEENDGDWPGYNYDGRTYT